MEGLYAKNKVKSKRQRSENWIREDKVLLMKLVRQNVKKIENKHTDSITNENKKKAWSEVARRFNALASRMRTEKQLKTQWVSMKVKSKMKVFRLYTDSKKNAGEAPARVPIPGDDNCAWLPEEFTPDVNEFDSDSAFFKETQKLHELEPKELKAERLFSESEFLSEEESVSQAEVANDLGTSNIVLEKTPNTKKKNTKFVEHDKDEHINQIASVDVECRRELHQLQVEVEYRRLRHMDELHQLHLEYETKRLRNMEELHQIQVESDTKRLRNMEELHQLQVLNMKDKYVLGS